MEQVSLLSQMLHCLVFWFFVVAINQQEMFFVFLYHPLTKTNVVQQQKQVFLSRTMGAGVIGGTSGEHDFVFQERICVVRLEAKKHQNEGLRGKLHFSLPP